MSQDIFNDNYCDQILIKRFDEVFPQHIYISPYRVCTLFSQFIDDFKTYNYNTKRVEFSPGPLAVFHMYNALAGRGVNYNAFMEVSGPLSREEIKNNIDKFILKKEPKD